MKNHGHGTSRRLCACLLMLPLAFGCTGLFTPGGEGLEENQRLWRDSGIESYTFRFQAGGSWFSTGVVNVEVHSGSVYSIVDAESGDPIDARSLSNYRTIDGLFEKVRDALDRDADVLSVTYDETLGYPTSIRIDYDENMRDDEEVYRASALVELGRGNNQ